MPGRDRKITRGDRDRKPFDVALIDLAKKADGFRLELPYYWLRRSSKLSAIKLGM